MVFFIFTRGHIFFFLIDLREKERKRNIDVRGKHLSVSCLPYAPDQEWNPQPFGTGMAFQPAEPPGQGVTGIFKKSSRAQQDKNRS